MPDIYTAGSEGSMLGCFDRATSFSEAEALSLIQKGERGVVVHVDDPFADDDNNPIELSF